MTRNEHPKRGIILVLALLALCALCPIGCTEWRTAFSNVTEGSATVAATPTIADVPPTATAIPTPAVVTLTVWTSEEFAPTRIDEAGAVMALRYETFMEIHPDVVLQHRLKKPYGKGGLLDFLITSSAVVPHMLPDVVIIDLAELNDAAQRGILSPLDDAISAELRESLYPWARSVGTVDGQWVGIPFAVELEHLVYPTDELTAPPLTWQAVLTGEVPYIFPAGGEGGLVNAAFLLQYWALGGELLDEVGNPAVDLDKVQQVLEFYRQGYQQGVFNSSPLEFHNAEECWETFTQTDIAVVHVSSRRFMAERAANPNLAFGFIPTYDGMAGNGAPLAVGRGWAVVITTKDSRRLPLAVAFVEHIFRAEALSRWTCATNYLPPRRDALTCFDENDEYTRFIEELLPNLHFRPYNGGYKKVAAALQKAVEVVLREEQTPAQALESLQELAQE